jgi:hypothetical protein
MAGANTSPWLGTDARADGLRDRSGTDGFLEGQFLATAFRFVPYRADSSDIMKDLVGGYIDLTSEQAISAPS